MNDSKISAINFEHKVFSGSITKGLIEIHKSPFNKLYLYYNTPHYNCQGFILGEYMLLNSLANME